LYESVILVSEKAGSKKISSAFFSQEFPADLALVVVWLAASVITIYLPGLNESPLRIVLALPVILFIPGYCLIAILFPKNDDLSLGERIMLSIGFSIAIVPLIGFGLNFTPWGIRLEPIVIAIILLTWVMVLVAHYQRAVLPKEERFSVSFSAIAGRIHQEFLLKEERGVDRFLSVVLILIILVVILATVYVIVVPKEGAERFSEFYILGKNKTAANYPYAIIPGGNYPLFIGVGNHEYRTMNYTIETWVLRTDFDNVTNSSTVVEMDPNDRFSLILAHNETKIIPFNLFVIKPGYNRVEFLLFNESVPGPEVTGSDRINASYRNLHLWVNNG
jgi:uncharacterized membrane protein